MIELTQSNNHHEIRDAIRDLCAAFPDEYFRKALPDHAGEPPQGGRGTRLSRAVRQCADGSRLDGGADPTGIRRLRPGADRSLGHHGRDQPLRRQLRRLPWPDVQHGHAAAPRFCGAKAKVLAQDCDRRMAFAVHGGDRAHHGHGHHQDQDHRREEARRCGSAASSTATS